MSLWSGALVDYVVGDPVGGVRNCLKGEIFIPRAKRSGSGGVFVGSALMLIFYVALRCLRAISDRRCHIH